MLRNPILFLATSSSEASKKFYESIMGFDLVEENQFALVFDAEGTELRIQKVQDVVSVPYTNLGWLVENIEDTLCELKSNGIVFEVYDHLIQDEQGIWTSPGGARIAWFNDPDNNTLSITQFPHRG